MNAWLKRCVFNLDLNRESVSEPRTLSGRLFQSLGARYEKAHSTRIVASSQALFKDVLLENIRVAAGWSFLHILIRFNSPDLDVAPASWVFSA